MRPVNRDTPLWAFGLVPALSLAIGAVVQYGPAFAYWLALRPLWWVLGAAMAGLVLGLGVIVYLALRMPHDPDLFLPPGIPPELDPPPIHKARIESLIVVLAVIAMCGVFITQ